MAGWLLYDSSTFCTSYERSIYVSRATNKMMQATMLHRLQRHTVNRQNSGSLTNSVCSYMLYIETPNEILPNVAIVRSTRVATLITYYH